MSQSFITESGFAEISVAPHEAPVLLDMLKARIRRLSHLDNALPAVFSEISSMARVCFVISCGTPDEWVKLNRLSREDVEAIYLLNHDQKTDGVLKSLNNVRGKARSTGPVDLDVSDQAAKSVYEVMET